jgi:hypothetical protein
MSFTVRDPGYNNIYNVQTLDHSLQQAVEGNPRSGQSVLDSAIGNAMTPLQQIGARSIVSELPKEMSNLTAGAAMSTKQDLNTLQGVHANEVHKIQNTLDTALAQSAKNLNVDLQSAQLSFHPAQKTDHATAGASMIADVMTPGSAAIFVAAAQAISDVKAERGKLKPEQEAKIADEMYTLLSPKRDMKGNIVAPPAIANDLDLEKVPRHEFAPLLKQLFMPPEEHKEGKLLANAQHFMDQEVLPQHTAAGEDNYEKDLPVNAGKLHAEGWSQSELINAKVSAAGEMLSCYNGIKPKSDGVFGAVGEALTALANEFNPRSMGLDNNPKPGMMS